MKVVVAVDSFKGSMTSMEAGMAVKAGVLAAHGSRNRKSLWKRNQTACTSRTKW